MSSFLKKNHSTYTGFQMLGLLLGPSLFFLTLFVLPLEGLEGPGRAALASALWVAVWWVSEAIPIEATGLLPMVLLPLSGALELGAISSSYGHKLVMLYLAGFLIAIAIERWNLHRRIALNIIYALGTNPSRLVLGFMVATGLLSMWISNTATSLMMLPIGMAVVKQLSDKEADAAMSTPFAKALMLGIAYAASIGGTATLIGTPPNLIFAAVVEDLFGIEITFVQWFSFGLPFSVIMMSICWWVLTKGIFGLTTKAIPEGKVVIKQQLKALGPISASEAWVLVIFSLTALAWISRSFLSKDLQLQLGIDDTVIGLMGASLLFMLPAPGEKGQRLLSWKDTQKLPWGILLLFGGGLALATGFKQTDLAAWMGDQLNLLMGLALIVVLLAVTAMINFLTEITSNLATASMIIPIVAALAISLGWHPYALMVPAILAASCAFMLPVATPPNAVAFGSGYLRMGDMIRSGVWLNLLSILLIVIWVYLYLPWIWDLDLQAVPAEFQLSR